MLKKRRLILILFLSLLVIVLSINYIWKNTDTVQGYENQIESRISEVVKQFDEDYIKLLMNNRPQDSVTFLSLSIPTQHPFYLFSEDGQLHYWSDNEMIPKFEDFRRNRKFQLFENTKGIYLTQIRKFERYGQGFWMIQVYSLFDNVEVQNEYLTAGYNPRIFGNDRFILSAEPKEGYNAINTENDEYLFSILFRVGYENAGQETNRTVLVFFFSLLGLVVLIGGDFVATIWKRGRMLTAIIYTAIILGSLRAIMIFFNFPQNYTEIELFDPSRYASSVINPSLGDLLLNVVCVMIVSAMFLGLLGRKRFLIGFIQYKKKYRDWMLLLSTYFLSTLLMVLYFMLFSDIVNNSRWNLNILALPRFDIFKGISLFIIFLTGALYLLFTIIGLNTVFYKNPIKKRYALKVLIAFSLPVAVALAWVNITYLIPFIAHFILLVSIISFDLYNNLFKLNLNTFLTFFFGCLVGAVITGAGAYLDTRKEEIQSKLKFAHQVLLEEDVMAEFLISDVMEKVREDEFIKKRLLDPSQSKEPIERKIRKAYLSNNFDQYEVIINAFSKGGASLLNRGSGETLDDYRFRFMKSDFATDVGNLFFVKGNRGTGENKYIAFINLYSDAYIGTIVIELVQQRLQPGSIFPKLLLDYRYAEELNAEDFEYAIFRDDVLQFSFGHYNYRSPRVPELFSQSGFFSQGVFQNDYHHIGLRDGNNVIIVSSEKYPTTYILADVALFFVAYLIFTLLSIFIFWIFTGITKFRFNYSTKLQFYLNFAFFFPMLIISVITVGLLSNSYTEDLHRQYLEKATIIRDNLSSFMLDRTEETWDQEELSNEVYQLAGNTNTDINLYLPTGKLLATNQPNIFEKKILTEYINPKAFAEIVEVQNNHLILDEQVGALNYKTVYLALRDRERQKILGIIAIPFFESEAELHKLIVEVFSNILNVFVIIFILFLVVSYFVSKRLTDPFRLLTQKLKTTDLENNEPMAWPVKDEIGLLINEYNNMLFKLEASLKILASNEKESAWKEMAKQVAHEIKNPLTPMKLTLQHMQRLQAEGKLDDPNQLRKPIQTLIQQVDILSDIATSFSTFAKMPLPENQIMNFRTVVAEAVELFQNDERGHVVFYDSSEGEPLIMGDPKLFGRVIGNLIINGIQSVNDKGRAEIQVILTQEEDIVKLEIRDNGKGIDEELVDKIFLPNFSTKSEGSGLGLAIAKRGVETAGGKIWFNTRPGHGTSFFLSFQLLTTPDKQVKLN